MRFRLVEHFLVWIVEVDEYVLILAARLNEKNCNNLSML